MTEKLADSDIDKFIREQKSRLALEKQELDNEEEYQRTTRRRWAEPDKENLNYSNKKEPDTRLDLRRPETPARQGYPVDNRQVIKQRKQLSEQRKQEYNDYLKSHTNNRRIPRNLTPTQKSIQVGNPNDKTKEILKTERRNDYNEYLNREKRKPRKFPGRKTPLPETRRVPYEPRPQERQFYDPQLKYSDEMPQNVDLRLKLELDTSDEYYPVETETPKAASLPIGQYEIQRREQAPEIKRRYRADLEKQLREKEQINRKRSGTKQKLDYGKARQDAFKKQIRVQGSPRKSAEKFGDMRKPPADYRNIKTFTEYNNSQSKHIFKNQYDYEQWQKKQIAALDDIERRQRELRLKLERDQTLRELEQDVHPHDDYEIDMHAQRLLEKNRSPSPHVDPPLYDPIEAEQLRQSARESPEGFLIPDNLTKEKADKLRRERQQDYQDMMAQRNGGVRTWREPSKEEILLDDKRDVIRKKLEEERKNEYNEYLKNIQNTRNNDQPRPGTPGGFLNKLGSHEKQRQKLKDERHEEYKRLQAEKMGLNQDFTDPRILLAKDSEIYATLPGMNYHGSATRGENEPPGAPRKGWGTPTYEEMLEKKRNEEQKYRRLNDPDYTRPGMKSYNSESALHRLENELPPRGRGVQPPAVHEYPPRGIREAPTYLPESNKHRFYATLPVGHEDRDELQKRKEEYKQELMRQMKEAEEARKKNKQDFIESAPEQQQQPTPPQKVIIIPNKHLPDVVPPQQQVQQQQQQQYQLTSGLDRLSPRSEMLLGRTRDLERLERRLKKIEKQNAGINPLDIAELDFISKRDPRTHMYPSEHSGTGILEQGFDRLLEPPKVGSVKVPVGLEYTPSTYVTGGDNFDKFSSVDKAYHYYGSHNPLDSGLTAPTQIAATNYGSVPTGNQIVVDNYRAAPGGGGLGGGGGGYSSPVLGGPSAAAIQESINQGSDAERKAKQRAQAQQYQRELERQMEEKKLKQAIAKEEKERYEQKLEDDIRNYNPFGRGGAGAPMKDEYGNVVADLRAKNKGYSPRYEPMSSPTRGGGNRPSSPKDDLIKTPPAQTTAEGESTYARGGHGIFGHPKTEAEKSQADRYKEELKRQIDNKKREAQLEKERERKEEERQQKIIDDQRRKMQEEYEEEKRRIQAKQDEQDRKNAEIIKLQEDQKVKEGELRSEKKKREEEGRLEYERQRQEREEYDYRTDSPLIPTLRHRNLDIYTDNAPPARNNSADVLNQLAHMRRQLQSERKRVENMLEETRNEPEVFDPRLVQRPPPQQIPSQVQSGNDIFETALNRNAVQVRRGGTADMKILQEFDDLKYKEDTDSRKQFRKLYPVDPRTQDDLESQQAALLRQQEERLRRLTESPIDLPGTSTSPQTMLHSNSAFIDVDGMDRNLFPDDFDDFPKRNESARDRRRQRESNRYPSKSPRDTSTDLPRNYNPMGSVVSLDVDRIQRKNDDRLQRLKEIQGDDVSLYDPDDVINRFMEKQSHNSNYDLDIVSRILTPE